MAYRLTKFEIQNFRSISTSVTLQFTKGELTILCGPNNNGKTNCLRAMDLFFRMDPKLFQAEKDRPYHITHGSRGGKSQTTFIGTFFKDDEKDPYTIKQVYKGKPATLTISLGSSEKKEDQEKARNIINQFQFIFVETNNVNLPEVIRKMFTEKILAPGMKKNRGQTKARERLQNFQEDCQKVVKKINNHLTKQFHSFFTDSSLKKEISGYKFNITFPQSLIEMMARCINITLQDQNDLDLEWKGSYQRLALFAMISYYAKLIKDKKVIWGIDEPEGSLQSKLQKHTFQNLKKLAQDHCIIITTHSSFFIDIHHLDTTFLLESKSDLKTYRNKDKVYRNTTFIRPSTEPENLKLIKDYIGIDAGDTWELFPNNILVEGETDRNYLQTLAEVLQLQLQCPNIIPVHGVQKMCIHLSFYNSHRADDDQAKDNTESSKEAKPKITCLLDRDQEGKTVYSDIKPHCYKNIEVSKEYVCGADDKQLNDQSRRTIEDLVYPEVILHATNQFLTSKKKFKEISKDCLEKRLTKAYQEKTFLEFLAEQARHADSHCNLNFNVKDIKSEICNQAIQYIKNHPREIANLDQNHPKVKEFLKNLFKFPKNSEEGPKQAKTGGSNERNDKKSPKPAENGQLKFHFLK